ncbi:TonB-dependent receptor [Olivibacter sp. SDN3]|uniref:SusC/RagA family TonB-linked outer membrane protein n=1 Tax=Olivibacter sp. SDN3 TaxID=2764720 RepID=UPI001650DE12|nr:TonB-dependent receptor [Olivibacter sp. SDN3]QNL51223.1 TonB-dependent receptor [Olivibacter sp. SDN3]
MRIFTYCLMVCCVLCMTAFAQQETTISGSVTDATTGESIPGVTVTVKETGRSVQTDVNGRYMVRSSGAETLQYSYIGYRTHEESITNRSEINVSLVTGDEQLDEVVVVGYGTQRKQDVTGSIASVQGSELLKQPVQTPTQALQGKAAGVQIIASGQPNEQPQVRVRGTGSMLAGAEPLYVVDGVLSDDIRNINNADIVSVDVLKDASAAIYGVRAANGVIIITTKKGQEGTVKVDYFGHGGFRQAANLVKMANREQYIDYIRTAAPARYNSLEADLESGLIYDGSTNWYDEVLRNAFQTNQNISFSGGSERSTFYVSAGIIAEDGIIQTNNFNRFNFRANNDVKISEKLRFSSQLGLSRANERAVEVGDNYRNVYRASPLVPARVGDRFGNPAAYQSVGNPVASLETRDEGIVNNRIQGNIALDYKPIKVLTLRSAFNTDVVFNNERVYGYKILNSDEYYSPGGGSQQRLNSTLSVERSNSLRYIWDNTVTFDKSFDKHQLTVVGGSVTEKFRSDMLSGSRINIPESKDQWYLGLGDPDNSLTNNSTGDLFTRQSFLGRVNYNFDGRYLLSASLRADGSSKFREKWGMFPTLGLGWVLSEESFMQNQNVFDFLKFRGSYGILGNDNIGTALYIVTGGINIPYFFDNGISLGTAIQDIKDGNLRWEKTEQIDFGVEFSLFNNRLKGEADYYNKRTSDALARVLIPAIFGDPDNTYVTNTASFRNRGVEFGLNWSDQVGSDFTYRLGGNITFNQNRVIGLAGGQAISAGGVGQQGVTTRTDNGQPVGSFYLLNAIGIFQSQEEIDNSPVYGNRDNVQPGDLKYEDVNGDGIINADDRIFAGSYQPKFYFGFNVGFEYKGFDLSADFYGNVGNQIYNGKRAFRYQPTDNIEASFAQNRWTPENPSQTDPRIIDTAVPASTYFMESGDFLRLNNLTVGYSLPSALLSKSKWINNLRLFATSQNLFTLQKFSGFSPELRGGDILASGIELNIYPTTRTFAFGISAGF